MVPRFLVDDDDVKLTLARSSSGENTMEKQNKELKRSVIFLSSNKEVVKYKPFKDHFWTYLTRGSEHRFQVK